LGAGGQGPIKRPSDAKKPLADKKASDGNGTKRSASPPDLLQLERKARERLCALVHPVSEQVPNALPQRELDAHLNEILFQGRGDGAFGMRIVEDRTGEPNTIGHIITSTKPHTTAGDPTYQTIIQLNELNVPVHATYFENAHEAANDPSKGRGPKHLTQHQESRHNLVNSCTARKNGKAKRKQIAGQALYSATREIHNLWHHKPQQASNATTLPPKREDRKTIAQPGNRCLPKKEHS